MTFAIGRLHPGVWLPRSFAGLLLAALALAACSARAQDDPPGRVGRVAELQGRVSWFDSEQGQWAPAQRNLPLTRGDRLSTAPDARSEVRIGSTTLRLGAQTEIELLALDDERISVQVHSGSLALRLRSREVASEVEVLTREARLLPMGPGHYRVDRQDDTTWAGAWRGEWRIDDPAGFIVTVGQRAELFREPRSRALRFKLSGLPDDAFAQNVLRDEQRDERSVSAQFVSTEMTGYEDLDRAGRWEQDPEYGPVWLPLQVAAGWAPYQDGRWVWVRPWGWTWVDNAPWGFAPFHYGRWVQRRSGWAWAPGAYVVRPVYAPALVAWVGPPGLRLSFSLGGPGVAWQPLAPHEAYRPHYRASPAYQDRLNPRPPERWTGPRQQPDLREGRGGPEGREQPRGREAPDRREGPASAQGPVRDERRDDRRFDPRPPVDRPERPEPGRSPGVGRPVPSSDPVSQGPQGPQGPQGQQAAQRPSPVAPPVPPPTPAQGQFAQPLPPAGQMGPLRPVRAPEAPRGPGPRDERTTAPAAPPAPLPAAVASPPPAPVPAPAPVTKPAVERPPVPERPREAPKEREPGRNETPTSKAKPEVRELQR